MDTIFTMETFISVVMIGYGIWMLFRSAQQLRTNIKLRNESLPFSHMWRITFTIIVLPTV